MDVSNYFDINKIKIIEDTLNVKSESVADSYTWTIKDSRNNASIYFTLHPNIEYQGKYVTLASIQTIYGYYELHNIQKMEVLSHDEIFFFSETDDKISCLSISKNQGVSIFANISKDIFKTNIETLDSALLLSSLQLSLFDNKNTFICK